ncbi:hypothetical protein IF1G_11105 [Cordyceps javanica]|uniref:Uncharacterized protein n=1 Tax=Cordyceps javanica TaxID=43265 RepID=A0A545UL71_9HYPO|nr:hypothetical protein IF1G_11105 [Cordyceps javanica]
MDESLTDTLHRASDLAAKDTESIAKLWNIARNATDFCSFSTEIATATRGLLPSIWPRLQISTLKETGEYEDTLRVMLEKTPGEQIASAKCDEKDGLTIVAIATIAVLCAHCGLYPPCHVELKNIASLLWDCRLAAALKVLWNSDEPRKMTVVPGSTAGSECDTDAEDGSNASTDDVYEDNMDRYRRGTDTT